MDNKDKNQKSSGRNIEKTFTINKTRKKARKYSYKLNYYYINKVNSKNTLYLPTNKISKRTAVSQGI